MLDPGLTGSPAHAFYFSHSNRNESGGGESGHDHEEGEERPPPEVLLDNRNQNLTQGGPYRASTVNYTRHQGYSWWHAKFDGYMMVLAVLFWII